MPNYQTSVFLTSTTSGKKPTEPNPKRIELTFDPRAVRDNLRKDLERRTTKVRQHVLP